MPGQEVDGAGSPPPPEFSIVVPTRNEPANVIPLVTRLAAAVPPESREIIFVDDSDDSTPETISRLAANTRDRIRLLHRPAGRRPGGLGGAVVAGILDARAPWVIVMDGDLQHPPEAVPTIIRAAHTSIDAIIASRYRGQGSADGLGGWFRRLVSSASGLLSRLAFPRRLKDVTDPMSGFFAVRRDALREADLRPRGYKILLEILVRSRIDRIVEVPYTFQPRTAGESKASLREGLRFVRHLAGLRVPTAIHPRPRTEPTAGSAAGAVRRGVRRWLRDVASGVRRAAHTRIALAILLTMLAVPATTAMAWNGLWTRGPHVPLLIPLAAAMALLVGRLRPTVTEPDVHDRQVDGLIAGALLIVAAAVTAVVPVGRAASSTWPLVASVAYLAAAAILLLGTRTAARLRWVLIFPLVATDAATPALLERTTGWLVRNGAALLSFPFGGRLDGASLTVQHGGQLLAIPANAIPGVALAGAAVCVALAGLCCFGPSARCLIRLTSASLVVTGVAILGGVVAILLGRLLGQEALRVALVPAVADLALATTVAIVVGRWSRTLIVPQAVERHYLPPGRIAAAMLALTAAALGLRTLPDLSINPPKPAVVTVADPGNSTATAAGRRP